MKVLVIGGGGREHAIAWKLAHSASVSHIYVAPGNAGIALEHKTQNVAIDACDIPQLIEFVKNNAIELTIVGPEAPLAKGIVDTFTAQGLRCFGPTQQAAQLESSKAFCKDFMAKYNIPTARYANFTNIHDAVAYIKKEGAPIVIKADGLAAGKGVIVAQTEAEAITAVTDMLSGNQFGDAGHRVVIEEFLPGEEASYIVITDGTTILPLASSQDHKARDAGDRGPNTGGMGAYSPAPIITPELEDEILATIIHPTLAGMRAEGMPYKGFLYAGIMLGNDNKPRVLEYNCRFGDPETQPILMRLQTDLLTLLDAAESENLAQIQPEWDPRSALGVVMVAGGYPFAYKKGDMISGLEDVKSETIKVFHAGTKQNDDHLVTNGGRVVCVTALGETIERAQQQAYANVNKIHWQDVYFRNDIGNKAIAKTNDLSEKNTLTE